MYIHRYASDPALPRSYDPRSAQGARQAARPYRVRLGARSPRPSVRVRPDRRAPLHVTRHCGVMARSRGSRRHGRVREAAAPRYQADAAGGMLSRVALVLSMVLWVLSGFGALRQLGLAIGPPRCPALRYAPVVAE